MATSLMAQRRYLNSVDSSSTSDLRSTAKNALWRKRSDGAGIYCTEHCSSTESLAGVGTPSPTATPTRRDSPPRRERMFELLLRYAKPQCEVCVSWSRTPGVHANHSCCLNCFERQGHHAHWGKNHRRRGSDPYEIHFNRILSAEEHAELIQVLAGAKHEKEGGKEGGVAKEGVADLEDVESVSNAHF